MASDLLEFQCSGATNCSQVGKKMHSVFICLLLVNKCWHKLLYLCKTNKTFLLTMNVMLCIHVPCISVTSSVCDMERSFSCCKQQADQGIAFMLPFYCFTLCTGLSKLEQFIIPEEIIWPQNQNQFYSVKEHLFCFQHREKKEVWSALFHAEECYTSPNYPMHCCLPRTWGELSFLGFGTRKCWRYVLVKDSSSYPLDLLLGTN